MSIPQGNQFKYFVILLFIKINIENSKTDAPVPILSLYEQIFGLSSECRRLDGFFDRLILIFPLLSSLTFFDSFFR